MRVTIRTASNVGVGDKVETAAGVFVGLGVWVADNCGNVLIGNTVIGVGNKVLVATV